MRLVGTALINGSKKSQTEKKPNNISDIKQNIDSNTKQVDESGYEIIDCIVHEPIYGGLKSFLQNIILLFQKQNILHI